jgi:hypothetical protein
MILGRISTPCRPVWGSTLLASFYLVREQRTACIFRFRVGAGAHAGAHAVESLYARDALVLDIAFAVSECHEKLLAVLLPSSDVGQDDFHALTLEAT